MTENTFTKAQPLNDAAEKLWLERGFYRREGNCRCHEEIVGIEFGACFEEWEEALAEAGFRLVEIEEQS